MQKSDSLDMLGQAMADAQPAVKTAIMGSTNPFFKSKYADLGAVWDAIREALKSKGLSIVQMPDALGSDPALTTILLHESGQWISGTYPLVVSSKDETAQGYGSAMTYARRYGLAAVMGVIADEDDDGNAASKPPKPSSAVTPRTQSAPAASEPEKPAITPAVWAQNAIEHVKTLDTLELAKWEDKMHLKIASLKPVVPDLHLKLVGTITKQHEMVD